MDIKEIFQRLMDDVKKVSRYLEETSVRNVLQSERC